MSLLLTNTLVPQLAGLIEDLILDGTFKGTCGQNLGQLLL